MPTRKLAPLQPKMNEPTTKMEVEFLRHYAELGDEVKAAELAGYSEPEKIGPILLRTPRLSRAVRILARSQSQAIVAVGQRVSAKWLRAAERRLDATDDPDSIDIKAVARIVRIAHEVANDHDAQAAAERDHLLSTSIEALERIAGAVGVDLSDITGRKLINGTAEKL